MDTPWVATSLALYALAGACWLPVVVVQIRMRTMRHADGRVQPFDSVLCLGADGLLTEYVNPWLGLCLQPRGVGATLQIDGVCFVVRCGRRHLDIPEWLALGHTTITERALDDHRIAMDFSLTHPLCGRWFRCSGVFSVSAEPVSPGRP